MSKVPSPQPPQPTQFDRRRVMVAAGGSLVAWMLAGCRPAPALTRVGVIRWIGYEPLVLARELGLLDESRGVRLVELPSNTTALMALASGDIDAATLTLDECLVAIEGGVDARVLWVFDESAGADVVLARPPIATLAELRGKRIGVEQTAAGALMLGQVLDAAQLTPAEIQLVQMTADQHLSAYREGGVDALITFEPYAAQIQRCGARRLIDSRSFPGLIVDVLVARSAALEGTEARFTALARAYFSALQHVQAQPIDARRRMGERLGLSEAEVTAALAGIRVFDVDGNRRWLSGPAPALYASAQRVAGELRRAGILRRAPALDHLIDDRFLPKDL